MRRLLATGMGKEAMAISYSGPEPHLLTIVQYATASPTGRGGVELIFRVLPPGEAYQISVRASLTPQIAQTLLEALQRAVQPET